MIAVLAFLFLLSPRPADDDKLCGYYQPINNHLGFMVNCDTIKFIFPAKDPKILLNPRGVLQQRPLYALLGTVTGYTTKFFFGGVTQNPFYWGYVFLNFVTLFASLLIFDRLLNSLSIDKHLIYIMSIFLICNNVTKIFLWTAHQQMLGFFTPLLMIYMSRKIITQPIDNYKKIALRSLLLGPLILTYGNFIMLLPCMIICYTYKLLLEARLTPRSFIIHAASVAVPFFVPYIVWVRIVTYTAGSFYNYGMDEHRLLVWMYDALRQGYVPFITKFAEFTKAYTLTFTSFALITLMSALFLSIIYTLKNKRVSSKNTGRYALDSVNLMRVISLTVFVLFFMFFWLLGFYTERLTMTLAAPAIIFITLTLQQLITEQRVTRKTVLIILSCASFAWIAFHVTAYGPFVL